MVCQRKSLCLFGTFRFISNRKFLHLVRRDGICDLSVTGAAMAPSEWKKHLFYWKMCCLVTFGGLVSSCSVLKQWLICSQGKEFLYCSDNILHRQYKNRRLLMLVVNVLQPVQMDVWSLIFFPKSLKMCHLEKVCENFFSQTHICPHTLVLTSRVMMVENVLCPLLKTFGSHIHLCWLKDIYKKHKGSAVLILSVKIHLYWELWYPAVSWRKDEPFHLCPSSVLVSNRCSWSLKASLSEA